MDTHKEQQQQRLIELYDQLQVNRSAALMAPTDERTVYCYSHHTSLSMPARKSLQMMRNNQTATVLILSAPVNTITNTPHLIQ